MRWPRGRFVLKCLAVSLPVAETPEAIATLCQDVISSFISHVFTLKDALMASPPITITDAFKAFKGSISEEDAHDFVSTTLEDVWIAVREIDASQRKRQCAQNLARIEPLLRGLEKYAKIIEVLCNGNPFLPYVWVSCYYNDAGRLFS
jgi:hypothetical protein